jgi:hypothetical protein
MIRPVNSSSSERIKMRAHTKTPRKPAKPQREELKPIGVRPKEAERLIGCGHTKLYEWINDGTLESRLVGVRTRIITMRSIERKLGVDD